MTDPESVAAQGMAVFLGAHLEDASSLVIDLARALDHVWGCPFEPFACYDPEHRTATLLVTAWRETLQHKGSSDDRS
jgi:hypothetical protein